MSATAFNAKTATCGGCGVTLTFKTGSGRVIVCEYCGFGVARTDLGLENLGKVADLVTTGAQLTLGATGRLEGADFTLVGRVQYQWAQGVWDEWYASFKDGRWGWLAEAQGKYYVSFKIVPRQVPAFSTLRPGRPVVLDGLGRFVVTDLKRAKYVAARGELPDPFAVDGAELRFADLETASGGFATFDYGGSDEDPTIFVGKEIPFAKLGIGAEHLHVQPEEKIKVGKISCPKCQGALELKAPDQAVRVTCPFCDALLDASQGTLRYLTTLKPHALQFGLGARCTFEGVEYFVLGWMRRSCVVEGTTYPWEEYLLFDEKTSTYRFLMCTDGHWQFVTPLSAGEVDDGPFGVSYGKETYKRFSQVTARVDSVVGEFYWAVSIGEAVQAEDFIKPPLGISRETSNDEVVYSLSRYLEPGEVLAAFGEKEKPLPAPTGVGTLQPNPRAAAAEEAWSFCWKALAACFGLALVLILRAPSQVVFSQLLTGNSEGAAPAEAGAVSETYFSPPFEIANDGRNLEIELSTDVKQSWAAVNGAVINEETLEVTEFDLETSYYSGSDSDGSWSEGSREGTTFLSALPKGRYSVRAETQWERGKSRPAMQLVLPMIRSL